MGNLILDSGWKSLVELILQSTIAPTMNLGSKLIEFYNISGNPVRIPYLQVLDLCLSITNWVMGTKVLMKFCEEVFIAIFPEGSIIIISFIKDVRFKPVKGHSLKGGKGIVDLCLVSPKSLWALIEVELALDDERSKFPWVSTIKGIWFSGFCS